MPTLGLAMIVRNGEHTLERLLRSVGGCFDEIIIVDTGSTDRTKEIAASFGARIFDFTWIDDFAAARNFSFSKASADYVMWLDADDILKPQDSELLRKLKGSLDGSVDLYYLKYDYSQDEHGNSTCLFSRERIVRNTGEAKWVAPIHEVIMVPDAWKRKVTDITVTHRWRREDHANDPGRNLRILRKAVVQYPQDARLQFYFGRELANGGFFEEAVRVLEDYLTKDGPHYDRVNAYLSLAGASLNAGKVESAIEACRRGIQFDYRWADFYVLLGEIYQSRKDWATAIFWLERAARCTPPDSIGFVHLEKYTWVPQAKLHDCYLAVGDRQKAYEANEKALSYKPGDAKLVSQREALRDVLPAQAAEPQPKVDIIIPTFNNLKYLKPCIESVRRQTDWPYQLIVVDSGDDPTLEWLREQPDIKTLRSDARLTYAQATNLGLKESKGKYVLLLNNDTIVSKGWLSSMMVEAIKPGVGAVGPLSNCDRGWSHNEPIVVNGRNLEKMGTLEDLADLLPEIERFSHPKAVVERFWVVFYAVLMPREVVDKVGLLDETFKNGVEDYDYCKRIRKAGYKIVNTYDSFVYHFFMRTPRPEPLSEVDRHNHRTVGLKYDKPLFVIYTGQAWEPWTGESLEGDGLGGSETAAVYIAQEFSKRGYRSIVFCDCKGREVVHEGVEYLDFRNFGEFAGSTHMDIFVSSRRPEIFGQKIKADHKICFATDVSFHTDNLHLDQVDRYFAISPIHKDLLTKRYQIPPEKMFVSRCGVDLSRFDQVVPRERAKLIYTSAPNRGLDVLLEVFPKIKAEVPEATLHIFYGFNYLEAAARQGDAWLSDLIGRVRKLLDQPGVVFRGRVPLKQLTKEILSASLWAYPTDFQENFCISAVEAMAAGVPVITSDYAALPSTIGDAGVLIKGDPRKEPYQKEFVEECVKMLTDEGRWKDYSARSRDRAKLFPWDSISDEWLEVIRKDLDTKK